jgi:hypothetical protein
MMDKNEKIQKIETNTMKGLHEPDNVKPMWK